MFEVVKFANYGVFEPECRRNTVGQKGQKKGQNRTIKAKNDQKCSSLETTPESKVTKSSWRFLT